MIRTNKFITQTILGICGGLLFGILGFLTFLNYGGNHGCFSFIDQLFNLQGYESCGLFGTLLGVFIGAILTVLMFNKLPIKEKNYSKITLISVLFTSFIPFLLCYFLFWGAPLPDFLIIFRLIYLFALLALLPSLLTAFLLKFFSNKKTNK